MTRKSNRRLPAVWLAAAIFALLLLSSCAPTGDTDPGAGQAHAGSERDVTQEPLVKPGERNPQFGAYAEIEPSAEDRFAHEIARSALVAAYGDAKLVGIVAGEAGEDELLRYVVPYILEDEQAELVYEALLDSGAGPPEGGVVFESEADRTRIRFTLSDGDAQYEASCELIFSTQFIEFAFGPGAGSGQE